MSTERIPKSNSPETSAQEKDVTEVPHHERIAADIVKRYAGDIDDDTRTQLVEAVAYETKKLYHKPSTPEELKKDFARLITQLQGDISTEVSNEIPADETPTQEIPATSNETEKPVAPHEAQRPIDADANQYDEEQQAADTQTRQGRTRRLLGLARHPIATLNTMSGMGMLKLNDFLHANYENRQKSAQQRDGETKEQFEKRRRRVGAITNLSTIAIGGAYLAVANRGHIAAGWDQLFSGNNNNISGTAGDMTPTSSTGPGSADYADKEGGTHSTGAGSAAYADKEGGARANADINGDGQVTDFEAKLHELQGYNNSDSSFYDFAHKQFRGDHGTPLIASREDGAMGAGFEDWMSRNKHESNGLGNLVSGLGLENRDGSMADRNALADHINGNLSEQMRYDEMVQAALNDPKQFKVETIGIDRPYSTTLMVDANGDPTIAIKDNVDLGGTAFKITNAETGEVTYWRKECGGYQQIWFHEQSSVTGGELPQGGGTPDNPQGGGTPPEHPQTPPEVPPELPPEIPQTPKVPETPLAGKTGDFHADEGAPLAEAGPLEAPAQTSTGPRFGEQPGSAVAPGQVGGTASGATAGTGGGRSPETTSGAAAAQADRDQSNTSANEQATAGNSTAAPTAPATTVENPYK